MHLVLDVVDLVDNVVDLVVNLVELVDLVLSKAKDMTSFKDMFNTSLLTCRPRSERGKPYDLVLNIYNMFNTSF